MNPQMQTLEYCFPQRVYYCPCLRLFLVKRKDVYIEKEIYENHLSRELLREKLNKNGVFLSSMRKLSINKYTDDCKSLSF